METNVKPLTLYEQLVDIHNQYINKLLTPLEYRAKRKALAGYMRKELDILKLSKSLDEHNKIVNTVKNSIRIAG